MGRAPLVLSAFLAVAILNNYVVTVSGGKAKVRGFSTYAQGPDRDHLNCALYGGFLDLPTAQSIVGPCTTICVFESDAGCNFARVLCYFRWYELLMQQLLFLHLLARVAIHCVLRSMRSGFGKGSDNMYNAESMQ